MLQRLVLDTNVWLDWLLFDDPGVAPVKAAVAEGRAEIVIDEAVEAELARVLAYPFGNKSLDGDAQAALLAQFRIIARRIEGKREKAKEAGPGSPNHDSRFTNHAVPAEGGPLPVCSDPDDQKFLELALACGATFLVTRDDALLELTQHKTRPLPYRIVTPGELIAELESAGLKP
jgi:predicted nucleic acid-binding protein